VAYVWNHMQWRGGRNVQHLLQIYLNVQCRPNGVLCLISEALNFKFTESRFGHWLRGCVNFTWRSRAFRSVNFPLVRLVSVCTTAAHSTFRAFLIAVWWTQWDLVINNWLQADSVCVSIITRTLFFARRSSAGEIGNSVECTECYFSGAINSRFHENVAL